MPNFRTVTSRCFALTLLVCLSTAQAQAQTRTKVTLLYTAVSAYLSAFVAKDQGFFEKRGLDVELTLAANGSVIAAAVESGSAQIGTPTPSVFVQGADGGLDQVALAATNVHPDTTQSGILARTGLEIKTAQDLVGKKVGVPGLGGLLDVIFRKWLTDNGVDNKRVTYVETSFPQMSDLLKAGQIDAVVAVDPFFGRIVEQKTGYLVAEHTRSLPVGTVLSVFSAKGSWVKANPDAVKAFQAAIAEANIFIKANPGPSRDSVAKYTKLPPPVVAGMAIPNVEARLTPDQLKFWIEVCKTQGLITGTPDPTKLVVPWTAG